MAGMGRPQRAAHANLHRPPGVRLTGKLTGIIAAEAAVAGLELVIVQAIAGRGATLNGSWQVMDGLDTRLTMTAEFGRSGTTFHRGGQAVSEPELKCARRAKPAGAAVRVTRRGGLYRLGVGGHDLAPAGAEAATELAARALGNRALARELAGSATRFGSALARVSAPLPGEAVPAEG